MNDWVLFDGFAWLLKSQVRAVWVRRRDLGGRVCVMMDDGNEFAGRVLPDRGEAEASMDGFLRKLGREPGPYRAAA